MPTEEELFASVDALLEEEPQLPPPAERARLREAAGITQARLAQAMKSTLQTVKNWENGRAEPRPPRLQAYQRLLEGWAAKYPGAEAASPPSAPAPQEPTAAPEPPAGPESAAAPDTKRLPEPASRPAPPSRPARERPVA
ncbi:helix-turn-helix domain-containing protein, partial [Streptomyces sp. S1A]|uniref:helix-turn-helix domain-containing protein n=1 Tax=Streptomyces sp. ICN903 TaxID=2964654 RepID=UPI001ED9C725